MIKKLKWGILGTGSIAHKFAAELPESNFGELAAVGSRAMETAREFTRQFPATAHGSYEALLADPEVEAVYISTPHPQHAEWAIRAADAGKHLLCEKPLTINHGEALKVVEAARRNGVFLMEAFMYRCHPQTVRLVELLRQNLIGDVRFIRATFSFNSTRSLESRVFKHGLAGGGILDVGCYCTSMARLIAGTVAGKPFEEPLEVRGVAEIGTESRVDEYAIASLKFPGGILAGIAAGVQLTLENNVRIVGTEGSILVPSPWKASPKAGFSKILLFKEDVPQEILVEVDRGLYAIEADHVAGQIAAGNTQSPAMSWDDTLGNMKALDAWRDSVGLVYDFERRP